MILNKLLFLFLSLSRERSPNVSRNTSENVLEAKFQAPDAKVDGIEADKRVRLGSGSHFLNSINCQGNRSLGRESRPKEVVLAALLTLEVPAP